jgi:two-component system chemotaxis response regulator CheB
MFESVAKVHGAGVTAVVMTGMGDDGLPGLRAVRAAGGRILAQDEETSVVFGMNGVAVAEGLAEATLPLDMIAPRLKRLVSEAHGEGVPRK